MHPIVLVTAIMINPTAVPDAHGEWLELHNTTSHAVSIAGWQLRSGGDPGFTIPAGVVIPANGNVVLARDPNPATNGGVRATLGYTGLAFGNGDDWLALRDARGVTADSVAWHRPRAGVVLRPHGEAGAPGMADTIAGKDTQFLIPYPLSPSRHDSVIKASSTVSELIVRVLDIGQGDAILISNGGSSVLIDGGPNPRALGAHLDALGLNGGTIDAVILSHAHSDHYQGLRELFTTRRHITVRYFWENQDPSPNSTLGRLRDSIASRVHAGSLVYRDTDDPCANGQPICTITLKGGAKIHIMRPDPSGQGPNNRSPAIKLIGPDSASFTMWLAGDAEQQATDWFGTAAGYQRDPGMRVDVLKADHHGSCNGVTDRYLDLLQPKLVVVSVGAINDYGHMHEQAKATYARHGVPWLRTDQNGTITLRTPGVPHGGYTVSVERGGRNETGPSDRRSTQGGCGN